jgi:prophage antirepressor-like protein
MNDIQIFSNSEFGEIRTVVIDDEPWFVVNDVAASLGYSRGRNSLKHIDNEDKRVAPIRSPLGGGEQDTYITNESGLYSLIFGSKLESAKKVKRWVTSEVLPSIRKNGTYQVENLQDNPMKLLELHYEAIKQVDKKVDNLSERIDKIEMDLPILPIEADKITEAAKKKGVAILGGKKSKAYMDRSLRQRVYNSLYANLKYNFGCRSYKAIKRNQCDKAIEIIQKYEPPFFLAEEITAVNNQTMIDL